MKLQSLVISAAIAISLGIVLANFMDPIIAIVIATIFGFSIASMEKSDAHPDTSMCEASEDSKV